MLYCEERREEVKEEGREGGGREGGGREGGKNGEREGRRKERGGWGGGRKVRTAGEIMLNLRLNIFSLHIPQAPCVSTVPLIFSS